MNSKIIFVFAVQFMLACTPLTMQAVALDHDTESEQFWYVNRELSKDYLNHLELRVKDDRQPLLLDLNLTRRVLQQSQLLQELLSSGVDRHVAIHVTEEEGISQRISTSYKEQESGLLEELLAESAIP